jgi:hypothetical protein
MKRVLVAGVLGGLLLLGTPNLASSAERDSGGNKGGEQGKGGDNKGGDNKGGDHDGRGDHGGRGDHDGRDRHDRGYDGRGYYGRGYYGDGSYYGGYDDCYRDPSGYTTCEEYGGDYDPWGYNYRGPRDSSVLVRDEAFNPAQVNVRPGQEVLWVFQDGNTPHTVTADNGSFDSGKQTDGEFRIAFNRPGTYSYHCAIHPGMKGRVSVGR